MTEQTEAELRHELEERLKFETLLTEISARYINMPVDQIDAGIEDDQRRICACLGFDLSSLWQWADNAPRFLTVTHLYSPPDGPTRPVGVDAQKSFPWVFQKMLDGETLAYSTEDMGPEAAVDQESRRHFGIKSSVNMPLSVGGGPLIGVLTFDTFHKKHHLPNNLIKCLQMVAQVFSYALARKESERLLRQNRERLNLAAESAEAGFWELDLTTNLIWATDKTLTIFGYKPGEIINMERFEASVFPEDLAYVRQVITHSQEEREAFSIEYRILADGGCMKWIHSSGRPYFKPDGKPDRLLGISIDITKHKIAQSEHDRDQVRLSSAIDIAGLGSYEMREDYRINFLDDRMRQFLGIPTDQETDGRQFWLTHIHPDDLARVLEVSRNVLEGGVDRFAVEYRYIHPDKKIIWFNHLSRVLERDGTGRATHVIGTLQNITGQKRMEIALKESMESYRAMVEAFDGLIYICSQDYRVEYMNKRLVERTGRDAVNELCYEALHDRDSICPWCVNEQVFKGEVVRWEVQSPKDQAWYYVVNSPIQHSNGTFSKLAMILDITKRKLMEESLRENEVILRNNQKDLQRLAGGLIRVKEEELRRLSRELHDDLTQRLAVIAIEAGKLEMHLKEPEMSLADQVEKIALIKKQLIRVSEDVHRISRQLHPTILEDLGLVRAIESECAAFRQTGDLEVVFSQEGLPENIPTEISLCLYRIIQEGLKNILRHGAANSCEVLLQSVDGAVHLTVRDDGTGFDPEEVGHKPGLGLSSMRERVLLVQGDFAIDTAPGRGTTINVTIPFKTGAT